MKKRPCRISRYREITGWELMPVRTISHIMPSDNGLRFSRPFYSTLHFPEGTLQFVLGTRDLLELLLGIGVALS